MPERKEEKDRKAKQAQTNEDDRLRGDSPDVLPDSETDSCVVVRRRNDKESDS